jgi:MFS family permease
MSTPRSIVPLVSALGVAQIISWGTLFYSIAVLGTAMRTELGVGTVALFGSYTAGLFASGLCSPWVGREIDRHGGRRVLAGGSVVGALAMATLALAQHPAMLYAGWILAGVASAGCLYDPAFATLHRITGSRYRRAVTLLTLYGGFASTVFWPLSQYLLDTVGWRIAYGVFAALHFAVCLPLHLLAVPSAAGTLASAAEGESAAEPAPPARPPAAHAFAWLASALALVTFVSSALAAHLIDLLTSTGLAARDAVLIGALIGPMQVAGRIMEFAFGRVVRPLAVGTLAFGLLAGALAVFTQVHGAWIVALAFVIPYGWSNGVMTIVRGTVPAELFGARGYGALLGRLAQPQFIMKAIAPVTLTLLFAVDPARSISPYVLLAVALVALACYRRAIRAR